MLTYAFGCFTKHWNVFAVLLVGRLFCGVATSLLYSAFESWLVAEHFKVWGPQVAAAARSSNAAHAPTTCASSLARVAGLEQPLTWHS